MADYATVAQFRLTAPSAQAFTNTADAVISAAIAYRSRWFDGFLKRKFVLPLVAWQDDLTRAVIDCAAYDVMTTRGFNPDNGADVNLRMRYQDAEKWARGIPNDITPLVTDSSGTANAPGENTLTPNVTSATQRGFSSRPLQPYGNPSSAPGRPWGDDVGD